MRFQNPITLVSFIHLSFWAKSIIIPFAVLLQFQKLFAHIKSKRGEGKLGHFVPVINPHHLLQRRRIFRLIASNDNEGGQKFATYSPLKCQKNCFRNRDSRGEMRNLSARTSQIQNLSRKVSCSAKRMCSRMPHEIKRKRNPSNQHPAGLVLQSLNTIGVVFHTGRELLLMGCKSS